ncbi:MAG: hypothetical protein JW934_01710 [Anaerolineae bacterium]|nr:hypothetical protein [Anaerolineae bacterium]
MSGSVEQFGWERMKTCFSGCSIALCLTILLLSACRMPTTAVSAVVDSTATLSEQSLVTSTWIATQTPTPDRTLESTNTPVPTCTFSPTPTTVATFTQSPTSTPTKPSTTKLRLWLKNTQGEPVPFSKATLLMEGWGISGSHELTSENNLLILPLEEELIRSYWNSDVRGYWHDYGLYIEAEGYVSVLSKPMYFIGTEQNFGDISTKVVIEFPNGPKAEIREGQTVDIELTLREPQSRSLCFIDDDQSPVAEIGVVVYMFWSRANHCGALMEPLLLAKEISDENGCVPIPDGDFQYTLELEKPFYHLKNPVNVGPMALDTYLTDQETVLELHKLRKQSLEMIVRKNGQPLANKILLGQWIGCPCMLCSVEIATTDVSGRIFVQDFYPEEWSFIFFQAEEGGGIAWEMDSKALSGIQLIQVELPK